MYAPAVQSQTGTGTSVAIALDDFQNPFNVSLLASLSGTATFTIEYTMDDPCFVTAANSTWVAVPNFSAVSATTSGAFTVTSKAVRINVASGTGIVTLKVLQAGPF